MALMKRFLEDLAEYLGVDLCEDDAIDQCERFPREQVPAWVTAACRVRLAEAKGEEPDPWDVKLASHQCSMWPRWEERVA